MHLVLAAVAGSILVMSRRERGWSAKLNSREWTVVVTLAGCFLRFLWATRDRSIIHRPEENAWFEGTPPPPPLPRHCARVGVLPRTPCALLTVPTATCHTGTAMLLRLPQVLWMGGSVILINVWVRLVHQFGSRADYDRVASRCKCMSAAFMAVLAALGLPLTVYSSVVSPDFVVSQLANLLFSAYLIGLTVAGTVYVRKMLRLLDTYQRTLDANNSGRSPGAGVVGPMRDRRAVFMRRLVVFVSVSCVLGWEVVVFTVVNIVADLQAKLFPVARESPVLLSCGSRRVCARVCVLAPVARCVHPRMVQSNPSADTVPAAVRYRDVCARVSTPNDCRNGAQRDARAVVGVPADLVFMYDVHVVAEGGFAAVYCYVCWGRSVASAKYAAPSARRVAGSPGSARGVALPPAPTSSGSSRRSKSDKGGSRAASAPTAAGGDQHRAARGAGDGGGGARGGHADASRDVAFENPVRSATASKPRATTGTASDRRSSAIVV